MEKAPIAPITM